MDDPIYARLLSGRDAPSVLEKEALWARLESGLEEGLRDPNGLKARLPKPWLSRLFPALTLAGAAAAALLVFFALPDDEYGTRGGGEARVQASCLVDEAPAPCAPGASLVLDATAPEARPFAGAFLESPDEVVWLFDARAKLEGERAFQIPAGFDLARGKLVVVFAAAPHDQAALEKMLDGPPPDELTVVERGLK